jgi:cobalt-precorrin 5A hydrolase
MSESIAIITITKHGAGLGERLHGLMPEADFFINGKFAADAPSGTPYPTTVMDLIAEIFPKYDGLVFFISLGAVIRMLAKHLQDKKVDPAVVVVDDRAQFAIAALSGHLGGANALTRRVAELMGGQAVITTASDVGGTIAVDLLGHEFGWSIDHDSWGNVTKVSAAVVNLEPVGVLQAAGEPGWWPADKPLPENVRVYDDVRALEAAGPAAALVITDQELGSISVPSVVYRPKSLAVGVGCMRGTSLEALQQAVSDVLRNSGLSPLSIRCLATAELKRDEDGITALARELRVPVEYFSDGELNAAEGQQTASAAERLIGVKGVSECAALLAAGSHELVVSKQVVGKVTVAIARKRF